MHRTSQRWAHLSHNTRLISTSSSSFLSVKSSSSSLLHFLLSSVFTSSCSSCSSFSFISFSPFPLTERNVTHFSVHSVFLVACYATIWTAMSVGWSVSLSVCRSVDRSPFVFLAFLGVFYITAPAFSLLVFWSERPRVTCKVWAMFFF